MKFQLPKKIKGPQAWYGQKIGSSNEWIYSLSHQELKEIERLKAKQAKEMEDLKNELSKKD